MFLFVVVPLRRHHLTQTVVLMAFLCKIHAERSYILQCYYFINVAKLICVCELYIKWVVYYTAALLKGVCCFQIIIKTSHFILFFACFESIFSSVALCRIFCCSMFQPICRRDYIINSILYNYLCVYTRNFNAVSGCTSFRQIRILS